MLNQDSQQSQTPSNLFEKASQSSTQVSFSPIYQEFFYIGSQEFQQNIVKIQLTQDKLVYLQKTKKTYISLFLTIMEQQIYLRDQKTVFAIKLIKNRKTTIFSTFEKDKFINLYLKLAKVCVLTSFQKHYRVGDQLGSGMLARVYDGFNLLSRENVALKVISKQDLIKSEGGIDILHNQIKALQRLRRYNISPLISTYETIDCYILVLQKGFGGNLLTYIQNQSQEFGETMLRTVLKQVLQNVSIIHEAGFIHRDIKPENIICKDTTKPSIFLCDYGISIRKDDLDFEQKEKYISGTIGYIAPEIINEERFDQKCDIFSVGCVFYYLFTGCKLFQTKNFFQLQIMCEDSRYIKRRLQNLKNLNSDIRNLLQNLLSFDPEDRPTSLEALKHSYFKDEECFAPNLGQFDDTLKQFLQKKIAKHW